MITLRMHRHGRELLLAAADKDLLGRELRGDGLRLEVCQSSTKARTPARRFC